MNPPSPTDLPTPREAGFRWPAEWQPHAATWLAWPHNERTWPGRLLPATAEYAQLARCIAEHEPVHLLGPAEVLQSARRTLAGSSNIEFWDIATNDSWIRDFGPIFIQRDRTGKTEEASKSEKAGEYETAGETKTAIVDWRYNAWGGKYPCAADDAATAHINQRLKLRRWRVDFVLEGGSIDGNGDGVVLTTDDCLLHESRNGPVTRGQIERWFQDYLAAEQIVWLSAGIVGDDTDGHVDQLARFVAADRVAFAEESNRDDENYASLQSLRQQLQQVRLLDGRPLDLVPLPMPRAMYVDGQRVPASYANFYLVNGAILVPQFGDPHDAVALDRLAACFPNRTPIGLDCRELIWGLGGFHCLTQQQPA